MRCVRAVSGRRLLGILGPWGRQGCLPLYFWLERQFVAAVVDIQPTSRCDKRFAPSAVFYSS